MVSDGGHKGQALTRYTVPVAAAGSSTRPAVVVAAVGVGAPHQPLVAAAPSTSQGGGGEVAGGEQTQLPARARTTRAHD